MKDAEVAAVTGEEAVAVRDVAVVAARDDEAAAVTDEEVVAVTEAVTEAAREDAMIAVTEIVNAKSMTICATGTGTETITLEA